MRLRSFSILRSFPILLCLAMLPAAEAVAMSVPEQEFQEAVHAKPDLERGSHYFETCARCHGPRGGGTASGEFPRIAGQYFPVLIRQLVAFRNGLRWDYRMEGFADRHRLPDVQAIADVADHLKKFWEPRMRQQIIKYVAEEGGRGLHELVLEAVKRLAGPAKAKPPVTA